MRDSIATRVRSVMPPATLCEVDQKSAPRMTGNKGQRPRRQHVRRPRLSRALTPAPNLFIFAANTESRTWQFKINQPGPGISHHAVVTLLARRKPDAVPRRPFSPTRVSGPTHHEALFAGVPIGGLAENDPG